MRSSKSKRGWSGWCVQGVREQGGEIREGGRVVEWGGQGAKWVSEQWWVVEWGGRKEGEGGREGYTLTLRRPQKGTAAGCNSQSAAGRHPSNTHVLPTTSRAVLRRYQCHLPASISIDHWRRPRCEKQQWVTAANFNSFNRLTCPEVNWNSLIAGQWRRESSQLHNWF